MSLWRFPLGLVKHSADMGSFDCVRLSPHFAQDDNGGECICDFSGWQRRRRDRLGKKTLLIFTIFIELGATIPRGSGS